MVEKKDDAESRQNKPTQDLNESDETEKDLYIYLKQVKDTKVKKQDVSRIHDKDSVRNVIHSLIEIGKSGNLDDFSIGRNCREWIQVALDTEKEDRRVEDYVEFLLNDFSSGMMTRMREHDKYVVAILEEGTLLLCHAKMGEKTITPLYQVVDRMLDRDNVERFAIFKKAKDSINVIYYEHSPSDFFVRWLGIPERDGHYRHGGNNRIFSEIDGFKVVLELTDDDIENKLIRGNKFLKLKNNQIVFDSPIPRLSINQIRMGRKRYASVSQFCQDYMLRRYNLTHYREEYQNLIQTLETLLYAYLDCDTKVIKYDEDKQEKTVLQKRNHNFNIIFAGPVRSNDKLIELDCEYLDKIYTDFENQVTVRVFHVATELIFPEYDKPLKIGSLEIYNAIERPTCVELLINYLNNASILDQLLKDSLTYSAFELLTKSNKDLPISYFFGKFKDKIQEKVTKPTTVAQNEDSIIEYKSASVCNGNNKEVAKKISDDLSKKLKENPFKIYFFGIENDTMQVLPLPSRQMDTDRLGVIESLIKKSRDDDIEVRLVRIPVNDFECIVMMIAHSRVS